MHGAGDREPQAFLEGALFGQVAHVEYGSQTNEEAGVSGSHGAILCLTHSGWACRRRS